MIGSNATGIRIQKMNLSSFPEPLNHFALVGFPYSHGLKRSRRFPFLGARKKSILGDSRMVTKREKLNSMKKKWRP